MKTYLNILSFNKMSHDFFIQRIHFLRKLLFILDLIYNHNRNYSTSSSFPNFSFLLLSFILTLHKIYRSPDTKLPPLKLPLGYRTLFGLRRCILCWSDSSMGMTMVGAEGWFNTVSTNATWSVTGPLTVIICRWGLWWCCCMLWLDPVREEYCFVPQWDKVKFDGAVMEVTTGCKVWFCISICIGFVANDGIFDGDKSIGFPFTIYFAFELPE